MKQIFALSFGLCILTQSFSQSEKFDIASFNPPQGWQRLDSNGVLIFHDYKTKNNLTSFGQIILFPSRASNNNAEKNFADEWDSRVTKPTGDRTKPTTQSEKTPDGWTAVTGYANITQAGLSYMRMLVTATGFGRTMSVMVNTAGTDHSSAIEKFFKEMELDSKAALALNQPGNNISTANGSTSFSDYQFIAPQGWYLKNNKDYLSITQSQAAGSCLILVFPPQPASGNLEADVKKIFDQMYPGWTYRFNGDKKYDLAKGYTTQGLEYCMLTASMNKLSADGSRYDGFEEGGAMVIRNNNSIAVIAVRHNSSMMAHDDCYKKYETCARFFNNFTIKNGSAPKNTEEIISKRIVGVWKLNSQGAAAGDYVFAANGHYGRGGGVGSSTTSKDDRYEYTKITSYAFQGDGNYSINGNQLQLKGRGENNSQTFRFRIEKVSHGGSAWRDRIFIAPAVDGQGAEVCYEKDPPTP